MTRETAAVTFVWAAMACAPKPAEGGKPAKAAAPTVDTKSDDTKSDDTKSDDTKSDDTAGAPNTDSTDEGPAADPPVLAEGMVAIASPRPKGPVTAGYVCSHSSRPFGTGYFSESTYVDPVAGTIKTTHVEGDTKDPTSEKTTKGETKLSRAEATKVAEAIEAALAGGPYRGTYPVPEGVVCRVLLYAGDEAFFDIQRTAPVQDEVGALLDTFVPMNKRR